MVILCQWQPSAINIQYSPYMYIAIYRIYPHANTNNLAKMFVHVLIVTYSGESLL